MGPLTNILNFSSMFYKVWQLQKVTVSSYILSHRSLQESFVFKMCLSKGPRNSACYQYHSTLLFPCLVFRLEIEFNTHFTLPANQNNYWLMWFLSVKPDLWSPEMCTIHHCEHETTRPVCLTWLFFRGGRHCETELLGQLVIIITINIIIQDQWDSFNVFEAAAALSHETQLQTQQTHC